MKAMARPLADPRNAALALAAIVLAALALAHALEAAGFTPCELCYWQRYPYYAAVPLLLLGSFSGLARPALALAALLFVLDLALALYHSGVEAGIFELPAACGAATLGAADLEQLKAQLLATEPVRCDRPALTVLGLSLANWNVLFAAFLSVMAVLALRHGGSEATGG